MPKIVVIDDSLSVLESIEAMLQASGFEAALFSEWTSAFHRVQAGAVDLIITDIYMPDTDGLEVIRARRCMSPKVPIVAMSGMSGPRDMLKVARLMGACQTLRKPFTKEQLLDTIGAALNGRSKGN